MAKRLLRTFMQDYKRKGSSAPPYIVYTFFTQLLFQKEIVLVRGDIINSSLSKEQAERMWQLLQSSYTEQNRFELVNNFNNNTVMFNEKAYNQMFGITV